MRVIEHSKPTIGQEELEAVAEVIRSGLLAQGEITRKFEEELSAFITCSGGVATSTGTLALYMALLSIDIQPGDEIIIPSYVCRSVLNAVQYCGAKPVLCDVNLDDYNICFEDAKKKISPKTKAIIIVHMFGSPAEIDKFKELGLYIIEDCAHSIGATYKGKKVGSWGDLSIFSFEGTKLIIAGEGGMVLTTSEKLLDRLRRLKEPDSLDYNTKYVFRMTNIQAAIGRVQLLRLPHFIKRRREIAQQYNSEFKILDIELPKIPEHGEHIFHRYMIKIKGNIQELMDQCFKKGVKVKQPVKPYPLHRYLNMDSKDFPNTELIMNSAVSIPIYPLLSDEQLGLITNVIREHFIKGI
jgi:dTDP-4-amino-4,6-dideoxygalactose transaminase